MSDEDAERVTRLRRYLAEPLGYWRIQATRPQTLAFALTDSPVGQLTWILDRFVAWSDSRYALDLDRVLATATLYWLTGTAGSSARLYFEAARSDRRLATPTVPIEVAVSPPRHRPPHTATRRGEPQDHLLDRVLPRRPLPRDRGARPPRRGIQTFFRAQR